MDTQQRNTPISVSDPLPSNVGPFNKGELEGIARICVKTQGLSWGDLDPKEQRVYLHLAEAAITGKQVVGIEPVVDTTSGLPKMYEAFQQLVLKEARASHKWDEDAFVRGFARREITTQQDESRR